MAKLLSSRDYLDKLDKLWRSHKLHAAWLRCETRGKNSGESRGDSLFPYQVKITRPSDKQLLHEFEQVQAWLGELNRVFGSSAGQGVTLHKQEVRYGTMGRQLMPSSVEFVDEAALARQLGQLKQWQRFCQLCEQIGAQFPQLTAWLADTPAVVLTYAENWPRLIRVCGYFIKHPKPGCYLRELDIPGVDSKFIEQHRKILKTLLDRLLPASAINAEQTKLGEHGFEKRYGLKYPQPRIRLRLLDPNLAADFGGVSDLEIPAEQFAQLDLICDRVFITENKINGLAFPELNNSVVIFGLGYGLQMLQQAEWLKQCRMYYWGDLDTHGFAMLSQARGYFPKLRSLLMDETTLLSCQDLWGEEPAGKASRADTLPSLTDEEQQLYQQLKQDHWQPRLRLEQERIPYGLIREALEQIASP